MSNERALGALAIIVFSCILPAMYATDVAHSYSGSIWSLRQRAVQLPNGDFNLTVNPLSLVVYPGTSTISGIVIESIDGFTGNVSLNPIPNFQIGLGLSASVNPYLLTVSSGGRAFSTLNVSATPSTPFGNYTVAMLAFGYGLEHNETVKIAVPGFKMNSPTYSSKIQQGSSTSFTVTISSFLGFEGVVHFELALWSDYLKGSVLPSTLMLASGGTNKTVVNVYMSSGHIFLHDVAFTLDLKATSGAVSQVIGLLVFIPDPVLVTDIPILVVGGSFLGVVAVIIYGMYQEKQARHSRPASTTALATDEEDTRTQANTCNSNSGHRLFPWHARCQFSPSSSS